MKIKHVSHIAPLLMLAGEQLVDRPTEGRVVPVGCDCFEGHKDERPGGHFRVWQDQSATHTQSWRPVEHNPVRVNYIEIEGTRSPMAPKSTA
jgi:hypothetical protein